MTSLPGSLTSDCSAAALEFPTLLALLASLTCTDVGRQRVLRLAPLTKLDALEERRRRYEEAAMLLSDREWVPELEEPLQDLLERLWRADAAISGADLRRLVDLLQVNREAVERIRSAETVPEGLGTLLDGVPEGEPLRRRISRTLDRRGNVRDDATPRLVAIRRRVRKVRDALHRDLAQCLQHYREHLSEETTPLREGRLVLLLQRGARGRVKGLVHGRSGSGRSVYFEPLEVVEPNNRLQESLEEEASERRRILTELVDEVCASRELLQRQVELLAELDLLQACWRFAEQSAARLAEIGDAQTLVFRKARHPLLDPELSGLRQTTLGQPGHTLPIVPLDLELGPGQRVLVVTGPNAGGKTVVLKTVGLLALAHQCGLPIPVGSGSRLPFFEAITATIGDEQDLLSDQSTFSGRLLRWQEAWSAAGPNSLTILDELGSGTDPEEGAALSTALLEGLVESKTLALITTHLTPVAAVALELDGASCAAMEFDAESGRPTYRLRPGAPGGSEALALASRLGLPGRWIERAEEILGQEHRNLRRLMAEVEEVRRQLTAEQSRLEHETAEVIRGKERLADETEALRVKRQRVEKNLGRELDHFRRKVTERLRGEVKKLRAAYESGRKRGLVAEARERLFKDAPLVDSERSVTTLPVEEGRRARHIALGWEGRVREMRGAMAVVAVGGKRLRCRIEELTGIEGPVEERPRPPIARQVAADPAPELNLVGWRVEPALQELDVYLDRALLGSRREVRVVHGFGSGRLRSAVRKHLHPHPAVAAFRTGRNEEGGDGATVVTLRES